jgi:hypothetical protein
LVAAILGKFFKEKSAVNRSVKELNWACVVLAALKTVFRIQNSSRIFPKRSSVGVPRGRLTQRLVDMDLEGL